MQQNYRTRTAIISYAVQPRYVELSYLGFPATAKVQSKIIFSRLLLSLTPIISNVLFFGFPGLQSSR